MEADRKVYIVVCFIQRMVKKKVIKQENFRKYNVNTPLHLSHVVDKYVGDQQENYPGYSPADLFRMALVHYLKFKKYLDADKRYL